LRDLLTAIPGVPNAEILGKLYPAVRSLMFELPPSLKSEATGASLAQSGIQVDYFHPNPPNVAIETLAKLKPNASGVVPQIVMQVPQRAEADAFALRFTGMIQVPETGKYTFFIASDDGSRVYVDEKLLIDNDALQGMSEKSATVELLAGSHPLVVTYFDNGGSDGLEVQWSGPGFAKQKIAADRLTVSGGQETIHDLAIRVVASIPGHEPEKFIDLAKLIKSDRSRSTAINVIGKIPDQFWAAKELPGLVDNLVGYLSNIPARYRTAAPAMEAVAVVKAMAAKLPKDQADAVASRLENLDVRVIAIGTVEERMIYDKESIAVEVGKPVEFRFSNTDNMPHNFAILKMGALEEVGLLSDSTAQDADAKDRNFVPKSDKVLLASRLLAPGETQAISFDVPKEPGIYPYVCTYPGHWRRMFGALYVVENLEEYQANPESYLAAHPLELRDDLLRSIGRNTEWKFDDLIVDARKMPEGRSFEVGKKLFSAANCIACHKLGGEGIALGPDLAVMESKKQTADFLVRSMVEPSHEINEKFQSFNFLLVSGKVVTGMVVEETADAFKVLADPTAKGDPLVVAKDDIEEQVKSPVSIMPRGLLDRLTREEILDLLAYLTARGNKSHAIYRGHDHEH
jgi:putative heme-binding domain-containing protein